MAHSTLASSKRARRDKPQPSRMGGHDGTPSEEEPRHGYEARFGVDGLPCNGVRTIEVHGVSRIAPSSTLRNSAGAFSGTNKTYPVLASRGHGACLCCRSCNVIREGAKPCRVERKCFSAVLLIVLDGIAT